MYLYLFPMIVIAVIYFFSIKKQIKYNRAINHTIILFLIYFALSQIESPTWRNLIGIPIIAILCLDFLATQFYGKHFGGRLEYSFALSIIETTKYEAQDMLSLYFRYLFVYLGYLTISITIINSIPILPSDYSHFPFILLCVFLVIFFLKAYIHNIRKNNIDSFIIRFLSELPISNIEPFMQVYHDKKIIRSLSTHKPTYQFNKIKKNIDTYVLVLGESARPKNMSLYGYHRPTTPILDTQKEQMLIFNTAYSPTSVTATAVPIALSKANIKNHQITDYSDNIIHIANHLGLKTYWFSNQGQYGNYSNAITGIAMNCDEKVWLSDSYDEDLLKYYKEALKNKERKLIVLHLYGSHVPSENRYPESERFFNGNNPDDFYDNSIRYTDRLLGEIIESLQNENASILYFSDHGLERLVKNNKIYYQHGGTNASIDAFKIPMCIWYSPLIKKDYQIGEIDDIWLSENNYFLIKNWLGVQESPTLEQLQQFGNTIPVMDTTGKIKIYHDNI